MTINDTRFSYDSVSISCCAASTRWLVNNEERKRLWPNPVSNPASAPEGWGNHETFQSGELWSRMGFEPRTSRIQSTSYSSLLHNWTILLHAMRWRAFRWNLTNAEEAGFCSSDKSVGWIECMRSYGPWDRTLHNHRCGNVKTHLHVELLWRKKA
jgi:hypothetical protein